MSDIEALMALVDKYGEACDNYTLGAQSAQAINARAAIEAAIRALAQGEPGEAAYWVVEWRGKGTNTVLRTTRPLTSLKDAETAKANLDAGYPSASSNLEYVIVPLYLSPTARTK